MSFSRKPGGCFEVIYANVQDMEPAAQQALLEALERETAEHPTSVLFVVDTTEVQPGVPRFWLDVTKKLAPRLCAMAIVSDNLVVRTAASGFSVSNRLRKVQVQVRAWSRSERPHAEAWCAEVRAQATAATTAPAAAPSR